MASGLRRLRRHLMPMDRGTLRGTEGRFVGQENRPHVIGRTYSHLLFLRIRRNEIDVCIITPSTKPIKKIGNEKGVIEWLK